jgi:hypothetical protein
MWKSILLLALAALPGLAQQAAKPNDYSDSKSWLCRPDEVHDACDTDLTTSVIITDGKLSRETWQADPTAPIDCFYVYPTVSTDPTPYSDMVPDEAEHNVIRQQFARFGSRCRLYAPMYRQITLVGLQRVLAGAGSLEHGLQYDDVRDAWHYYLEHDNRGRGFVLIGHSQGSFILAELIRQEIDGKPVESRMVSAILLGTTIAVPRGKDVGGSFQHVPLCHAESQAGCLITYASFRASSPPPRNTLFGKVSDPDMVAACTDPAALAGGNGELIPYFSTQGRTIVGTSPLKPWVAEARAIGTPWVSVRGLLTAECKSNPNATYLAISLHSDPQGRRTDEIPGDLAIDGQVQTNWGLHLVDMNLAMGNLIEIIGAQAKAWLGKK